MKTYKKAYITTLVSVAFLIQSFLITIIEIQILKSDLVQHPSAIYGTKSVWDDNRYGNWDVYTGNLSHFPVAACFVNRSWIGD
jgi:beta propeller repeat protein